ncbi:MAG: hypothetical protein E7616_02365 [Ruminococcaceae bacterium]|nr:hypothetical protein [Oscillospiraceae bacterium]
MKKYTSRATKWLAILTIISVAVLIAGIICILPHSSNVGLQIGLTMLGGLMSILFLACYFVEKSRYLTIDCEKIVLPRGADKNGKMSFQKIVININEIRSIKSELYKGDGIISKDTLFHKLKLKDGIAIKFTLYAYGKDAEKEILESIKKHV